MRWPLATTRHTRPFTLNPHATPFIIDLNDSDDSDSQTDEDTKRDSDTDNTVTDTDDNDTLTTNEYETARDCDSDSDSHTPNDEHASDHTTKCAEAQQLEAKEVPWTESSDDCYGDDAVSTVSAVWR